MWLSECQLSPVLSAAHQQKGMEGACIWSAPSVAWSGAGFARPSGPGIAWLVIGLGNGYFMSETISNLNIFFQKVIVCDISPDLLMNWQYNQKNIVCLLHILISFALHELCNGRSSENPFQVLIYSGQPCQ